MNRCGEIGNIHVTTFKSSKGLEFDTVIIPNFDIVNRVPVNMRGNIVICTWNDLYVAVTRAKSNLYLITNNDMPELSLVAKRFNI